MTGDPSQTSTEPVRRNGPTLSQLSIPILMAVFVAYCVAAPWFDNGQLRLNGSHIEIQERGSTIFHHCDWVSVDLGAVTDICVERWDQRNSWNKLTFRYANGEPPTLFCLFGGSWHHGTISDAQVIQLAKHVIKFAPRNARISSEVIALANGDFEPAKHAPKHRWE